MDDPNASLKGHGNRHLVFRDSVHWGRHEWSIQLDISGELRGNVNVANTEMNVSRHHDEIVISVGNA